MVVKLCEFMSARHAALPVKNFPVARQSDPSPPTEVNNPASAINLKKLEYTLTGLPKCCYSGNFG